MASRAPIRRLLTQRDKKIAANLRRIFAMRKQTHGMTQTKLAKAIKVSQPTINQYLNETVPLANLGTIINLANALQVHPTAIDPTFSVKEQEVEETTTPTNCPVYTITCEGLEKPPKLKLISIAQNPKAYGVTLPKELIKTFVPHFQEKVTALIDPSRNFKKGGLLCIRHTGEDSYRFCYLKDVTTRTMKVKTLDNLEIAIPLKDILSAHKVIGFELHK